MRRPAAATAASAAAGGVLGAAATTLGLLLVQLMCVQLLCFPGVGTTLQVADGEEEVVWPRRNPEIEDFVLTSSVEHRYAITHVTSIIRNNENEAKEAVFSVRTPKAAFISHFSMLLNGKFYHGRVQEKTVASKTQFVKFRPKSQRVEKIADTPSSSNIFRVSVTLAAHSRATFNLTYEELLIRRLGLYDYAVDLDPGQVIKNLKLNIRIAESQEITKVEVPSLQKSAATKTVNPFARIRRIPGKSVTIAIEPTPRQQLQVSPQGISGQFHVRYDVRRLRDGGHMQISGSHFVHFFAPSGLPTIPKDIIFILDVSGSMSGMKLAQTQDAMCGIVDALHAGDRFNVMTFSSFLRYWNRNAIQEASDKNKKKAKQFLRGMTADGGTNINDAILRGLELMKRQAVSLADLPRAFIIVFLTDGEPTSGITHTEQILANVRASNQGKYTIFGLGLGRSADHSFLQKLSVQNGGYSRRISDDATTGVQLQRFYSEISDPLLSEVNVVYPVPLTDEYDLVKVNFPTFFKGSELALAGTFATSPSTRMRLRVSGESTNGSVALMGVTSSYLMSREYHVNVVKRIWAYVTVRGLLQKVTETKNVTERTTYERNALSISLQYSFVNRLTSMVVVKPEEPKKDVGTFRDPEEEAKGKQGRKGTRRKTMPGVVSRSRRPLPSNTAPFVDNDPHFIISLPGSAVAVCFDIAGAVGDVYQLVHDPVSGVVVNGQVVGKKPDSSHQHMRTYFGKIAMMDKEISVIVMPSKIKVNDKVFKWKNDVTHTVGDVTLEIRGHRNVSVSFGAGLAFIVVRHKVRKYHPIKVDYLGFYIDDGSGLSTKTHGLIGQFHHQRITVERATSGGHGSHRFSQLRLRGPRVLRASVRARMGHRMNMLTRTKVPCWQVPNNGHGFIEGKHQDYVVPDIDYKESAVKFAKLRPLFH